MTWINIDFENKTLTIDKNIIRKNKDGLPKRYNIAKEHSTETWFYGSCKNPQSRRTIAIGDTLIKALKEYKRLTEDHKNFYGDKYFIKYNGKLAGFVLINENNKFNFQGKTIAEFLILPPYRRKHLGKEAAIKAFELYPGNWEVQPMENNPIAYSFWNNVISMYTKGHYITKNTGIENIFIFNNEVNQ